MRHPDVKRGAFGGPVLLSILTPCLPGSPGSPTAAAAAQAAAQETPAPAPDDAALAVLRAEAQPLVEVAETEVARELLRAVALLAPAERTTVHYRGNHGPEAVAYTGAEFEALAEAERAGLTALEVDTDRFYNTFYGSPLAAVRTFDLAASHGFAAGPAGLDGQRVLDFGFGSVGQLRLLAACGADAVGLEVMPLLRAIYAAPGSEGEVAGLDGRRGSVRLVFGHWPAGAGIAEKVGAGYDLFVSKNTLKRGYVAPRFPVDPRRRLDLGLPPEEFLDRLHAVLAPGGLCLIYNLGSGSPGEGAAYDPSADIESPWPREVYAAHGFDVLALDEDDSEGARAYGRALGWFPSQDAGAAQEAEAQLFARFTVLRRAR